MFVWSRDKPFSGIRFMLPDRRSVLLKVEDKRFVIDAPSDVVIDIIRPGEDVFEESIHSIARQKKRRKPA